jgi:hypothetical protein
VYRMGRAQQSDATCCEHSGFVYDMALQVCFEKGTILGTASCAVQKRMPDVL